MKKSFNYKLLPLKQRVICYIVSLPLIFLITYYKLGFPFCLFLTLCFALFFTVSTILELRSHRNDIELKHSLESGEYYTNEKWRQSYAEYARNHDFKQVKGNSMKADLSRYYISKSGIVMLVFAVLLFVCICIFRNGQEDIIVGFGGGGLLFAVWGAVKLIKTPVNDFIRSCGEKLPEIERSYLNGRMLTYSRNGDKACKCGINIGGNYTVLYNNKKIDFIDNSEIESVSRFINKTKYYNNYLYSGDIFTYTLLIELKQLNINEPKKQYSIVMNEFQVEMAYDALHRDYSSSSLSVCIHAENG